MIVYFLYFIESVVHVGSSFPETPPGQIEKALRCPKNHGNSKGRQVSGSVYTVANPQLSCCYWCSWRVRAYIFFQAQLHWTGHIWRYLGSNPQEFRVETLWNNTMVARLTSTNIDARNRSVNLWWGSCGQGGRESMLKIFCPSSWAIMR